MINNGSENNKLEIGLKHYNEEIKKLLMEKEHYQKELDCNHYQMEKVLVENDHYKNRNNCLNLSIVYVRTIQVQYIMIECTTI
jgi:hypothetical protein